MGAYILILCFLLLVGLLSREAVLQGRNTGAGVIVVCAFTLFIPAAIRASTVGADTQQYCDVYSWIATVSLEDIATASNSAWWSTTQDYTYLLYNKAISVFGDNPQIITVANSALLIASLARFVRNESCDPWMSFLLYFTFGFFQLSLNLTPSTIASLILLGSLRYVRERRLFSWIFSVAVAYIFHASAVLFIPLYFLFGVSLSRRDMVWVCVLGMFCGLFAYSPVMNLLSHLVPVKYASYLTANSIKYEAALVLVAYGCVLMVAVLSEKRAGGGCTRMLNGLRLSSLFAMCSRCITPTLRDLLSFSLLIWSSWCQRVFTQERASNVHLVQPSYLETDGRVKATRSLLYSSLSAFISLGSPSTISAPQCRMRCSLAYEVAV